jgi:transcriptional repressor NrdR
MRCPFCGAENLRTLETRDSPNNMVRRRKECLACGKRMTTYEYIEEIELMVKKKDGRLERFNPDKIIKGLQKACEKRPVSLEQIKDIAENVRQEILAEGRDEVTTKEIGDRIIAHLRELDYVAYVRFASVYRDFKEPEDFHRLMNEEKEQ